MGKFPDMAFGRVVEAVKRMEWVGAQEAGSNLSTIASQLQASPMEHCVAALDRILDRGLQPAGDQKFRAGRLGILPDIRGAPRSVEPPRKFNMLKAAITASWRTNS